MLCFSILSCWNFETTTSHTWLPLCVLQWGRHIHIEVTRNIRYNKLEKHNDNFLFWLKVWLSKNQFEPIFSSSAKKISKLPCTETAISQLPKQVHRSPRRHIKDNGQCYIFLKGPLLIKIFVKALEVGGKAQFFKYLSIVVFSAKHNFLKDDSKTSLYLLDLNGFWLTYGLLHYEILPSYNRVRWGRLAGPSHSHPDVKSK